MGIAPAQIAADEIAASQDAFEVQRQFEQRLQQSNADLRQSSQKVYSLLASITGQSLAETPAAWWDWCAKPMFALRHVSLFAIQLTVKSTKLVCKSTVPWWVVFKPCHA